MTQNKLPKDWKYKRLGEMFNFVGGGTPSKTQTDFWNGKLNWASVKDVKGDYLNSTKDFITDKGLKNSASNLAEKGDVILITRISPGKSIITNIQTAVNQDLKIAKPKFKTSSKFIYYFFCAIERDCIKKSSGTTVLGITLNNLNELLIPDLSIEEQNGIVSKIEELFSELDKGIEDLKTAQQQLKIYRQSVLKYAFEGKKRILFENIIESSQNGLSKRNGLEGEEFNVLRLADIKNNSIVVDNSRKIKMTSSEILKYKLKEEDLVCIRVNGSKDLVGKIVYVTKNDTQNKWAFCDHFIRFTIKENFNSKFVYHYFQTVEVRKFIHDNIVTSAGQNTVSQVTIKNVLVPDCRIEEQHQIVQEIETRLSVADKMEESIVQSLLQAEALRQSILKKAFSGQLL